MNILRKLTKLDLKLNKKRTIGTLLGIILATALITVVGGMFEVMRNTLVQTAIESSGYYHIQLLNLDKSDLEEVKKNKDFKRVMTVGYVGITYDDDENNYSESTVLSTDEETFKELKYEILEGSFPKNDNEILIDNIYARDNDIKIGDTVKVATDIKVDGTSIDIKYDDYEEYKVVGTTSVYGTSVIKEKDTKIYMAYLTLRKPSNHVKAISKLLGVDNYTKGGNSKYLYQTNRELLRWEVFSFGESTTKMLVSVVSVVIGIILITSVFSIRNSFAISTNEKIKLYGMLASTGATKKQIRRMVLFEGFCMGLIGILGGIILGSFVVWLLTLIINNLAVSSNLVSDRMLYYKFSFISIIIATLVSIIMIYLSTISSSRKAGRVSPIQNIRNSDNIKAKKLKVPFFIRKIFKTGGVLSYKNLKRSKKKYRVTVISLTVSICVFITASSFLEYGLKEVKQEFGFINYDVAVHVYGHDLNEDEIKSLKNLDDSYTVYNDEGYYQLFDSTHVKNTEFTERICTDYSDNGDCLGQESKPRISITFYDDYSFKKILKDMKLDYDSNKDKIIIMDTTVKNKKQIRITDYKKGDTIELERYDRTDKVSYKVAGITENMYPGMNSLSTDRIGLIINGKYFDNKELEVSDIYYKTKNPSKLVENIEDINEHIDVENVSELSKQLNTIIIIFSIFMYGFIIVITLIGVTSVFNTINSNMELRKREFATLKSIGMTKREFNNMIMLESVFYSFKSLMYGIVLGLGGSYLIYNGFKNTLDFGYLFPIKPIIICIVFIVGLVYLIMKYSIDKTRKQNIIETIRKENI